MPDGWLVGNKVLDAIQDGAFLE